MRIVIARGTDLVMTSRAGLRASSVLGVLGAALLLVPLLPAASSPARVETTLELKGALTNERIVGFGTLDPGAPRRTILLRLLIQIEGGYNEIARKKVDQRGRKRGGFEATRFSGSFPSPSAETCKLIARFKGTLQKEPSRDAVVMPCARPDFPTGQATMTSVTNGTSIPVEIADTSELRAFGLMYLRRLASDRGMAFDFDADTSGGFWMKNTLIPLSIAFYDAGGTIVRILDMEPCEADPCPTYDPEATYRGALEVNQGMFDEWSISEGDHIVVTR